MGVFFPPPGEAIDGHSRAGALTPVDRSCLRHITRVTADIRFTSGAAADILDHFGLDGGERRQLQTAAETGRRFIFGTAGFQLLVQAVISTPSIQCQNVLYVCCLSVLPALRQSSYPFFFSVFFVVVVAVVVIVCAFILHLFTRLLCSLLYRSTLYYCFFL